MSDEMDFTKPQPGQVEASAPFKVAGSRFFDSVVAGNAFRRSGKEERFEAQQIIFAEEEKASKGGLLKAPSRMYFIAEGEVTLTIAGRPLESLGKGEIFGEMAVISERPRSATARASKPCRVYSLDAAQLQLELGRNPEFGLMLASVMYDRLRFVASRLAERTLPKGAAAREATVLESALVAQLEKLLPTTAIVRYAREKVIFKEGQAGTFMYLVKSGKVAIAVGSNLVEVIGPGGTFGEMAVVDESPRTARAGALVDTELVAIDRESLILVVGKQPAIAMAMLKGVADRLRHMNAQLS